MLRAADPEIRDRIAYTTLATWIGRGDLPHDLMIELGDEMAQRLTDEAIQARTFAPLIPANLVGQGAIEDRWITAFEAWWPAERDLRGYDPGPGRLHAVAHGADLAGEFGVAPGVAPERMFGWRRPD